MAERWNLERIKALLESNGCKLLSETYEGYQTPLRYVASCGHEYSNTLSNLARGKGLLCKDCRYGALAHKRSRKVEELQSVFEKEGCKLLSDFEANSLTKLTYIAQCGHENVISLTHFLTGGGRMCNSCSHSVRYQYDYVAECFEQENCVLLEDEYVNCKTPMRYLAKCGHESVISFDVFQNAPSATKRCKACHKHTYHEVPSDRNLTMMKNWRKSVYEKDGFNCVRCGKHGGDLNAHHVQAYDTDKDRRFSVDNGATLCISCHTAFHQKYGFGGNTKEQFYEWLQGNTEVSTESKDSVTP